MRADQLRTERDTLVRELAAAAGFGGRTRRLGDQAERARKTISARVRDALTKIESVHPQLAAHLRSAVRMGTTCSYAPAEPVAWTLSTGTRPLDVNVRETVGTDPTEPWLNRLDHAEPR